jgi:hypothetical protein
MAVGEGHVSLEVKQAIVRALSHPALPCPTRGLEFVLYERGRAAMIGQAPLFEINLNTGPRMQQRVSFDPSIEPPHWFILDVAIARQRAIPLVGPLAPEVFTPIPDHGLSMRSCNQSTGTPSTKV